MPSTCRLTGLAPLVLIVNALAALCALDAAEPGQVLVAPASPAPLNVAVPLESPVKLDATGSWQLVEVGGKRETKNAVRGKELCRLVGLGGRVGRQGPNRQHQGTRLEKATVHRFIRWKRAGVSQEHPRHPSGYGKTPAPASGSPHPMVGASGSRGAGRVIRSLAACAAQARSRAQQHFLYFLPLPQGHGSLRPTFAIRASPSQND